MDYSCVPAALEKQQLIDSLTGRSMRLFGQLADHMEQSGWFYLQILAFYLYFGLKLQEWRLFKKNSISSNFSGGRQECLLIYFMLARSYCFDLECEHL